MVANVAQNAPTLWMDLFPIPTNNGHKYHRGHAAIYGAPELTGATRLAAQACNRIGSGLVTVVAETNPDLYRITLPPDIMVRPSLPDSANVALAGSGGIQPKDLSELIENTQLKARVFDADTLQPNMDFTQLDDCCVLTPHLGEFERVFGPVDNELETAAAYGAATSGSILVLKSSKTIIAHPDGRLVINTHTSPYLAKAGTGDVLAGTITGLISQGMPHFQASCAAVWIHGDAGRRLGAGLVASDIPEIIPQVLRDLLEQYPSGIG